MPFVQMTFLSTKVSELNIGNLGKNKRQKMMPIKNKETSHLIK